MNEMEKVFTKNENIIFRKIADEFILVPIKQKVVDLKSIYTLNEVAATIWQSLDGKKNVQQLKEFLLSEYETEPEQVETDLQSILDQLSVLELIQEANS